MMDLGKLDVACATCCQKMNRLKTLRSPPLPPLQTAAETGWQGWWERRRRTGGSGGGAPRLKTLSPKKSGSSIMCLRLLRARREILTPGVTRQRAVGPRAALSIWLLSWAGWAALARPSDTRRDVQCFSCQSGHTLTLTQISSRNVPCTSYPARKLANALRSDIHFRYPMLHAPRVATDRLASATSGWEFRGQRSAKP